MPGYLLTFHDLGTSHNVTRRVTADPTELAQAAHRHARGYLGSGSVNVRMDPDSLTGTITSHGAESAGSRSSPTSPPPRQRPPRNHCTATPCAISTVSSGRTPTQPPVCGLRRRRALRRRLARRHRAPLHRVGAA